MYKLINFSRKLVILLSIGIKSYRIYISTKTYYIYIKKS